MAKIKKDFERKKFHNPLFPRLGRKKNPVNRWLIIGGLFVAGLLGVMILNLSGYFNIRAVEVSGNEYISQEEISNLIYAQMKQRRFLLFSQSSLIFFSQSRAAKALTDQFYFDQVQIKKLWPSRLNVKITEKFYALIMVSRTQRYYVDFTGRAIKLIDEKGAVVKSSSGNTQIIRSQASIDNRPLVFNLNNDAIKPGQMILPNETVNFVDELHALLKSNANFTVSHYSLDNLSGKDLTMITQNGWKAIFNASGSAESQAALLDLILGQKIQDKSKLKYIDLRFEGKVFYQ